MMGTKKLNTFASRRKRIKLVRKKTPRSTINTAQHRDNRRLSANNLSSSYPRKPYRSTRLQRCNEQCLSYWPIYFTEKASIFHEQWTGAAPKPSTTCRAKQKPIWRGNTLKTSARSRSARLRDFLSDQRSPLTASHGGYFARTMETAAKHHRTHHQHFPSLRSTETRGWWEFSHFCFPSNQAWTFRWRTHSHAVTIVHIPSYGFSLLPIIARVLGRRLYECHMVGSGISAELLFLARSMKGAGETKEFLK